MPYEIINRGTTKKLTGIQMGNKTGKFLNNIMRTEDAGLARAIRQKFGQDRKDGVDADVLLARVPDRTTGLKFSVGIEFDKDGNRV